MDINVPNNMIETTDLVIVGAGIAGLGAAYTLERSNFKDYLVLEGLEQIRSMSSLWQMHRTGPHFKKRKAKNPLCGQPYAKGVVLKTLIKKPKKPNSANRKCVLVRLSAINKEMIAYIPGVGHNLQEHNIVLIKPGKCKDTPHVKVRCVRGKYDLAHVVRSAMK
ncbi:hypothetical protein QAD02_023585 [Eretmocerus hayati]|uniref:Uncharacterized protein n=1 Tax=Eretmocerus hayati TaxID=131215 RepID=A0ACC2PYE5_9HYME|nr:hypothetical protein QAD02_023585 [Eretmocerus hayati]